MTSGKTLRAPQAQLVLQNVYLYHRIIYLTSLKHLSTTSMPGNERRRVKNDSKIFGLSNETSGFALVLTLSNTPCERRPSKHLAHRGQPVSVHSPPRTEGPSLVWGNGIKVETLTRAFSNREGSQG